MKILAPAKINLFLEVTRRRKDGYHSIESFMQKVSLYDRLTFKLQPYNITIESNLQGLPIDESNIVYKAALLLKNELKIDKGVHVHIEKRIPVGAGLGGGSSDAAAALKGLLKLWKRRLTKSRLLGLAKKLGADVPFFMIKGAAVARGIGEKLQPVEKVKPARILLVNPGFGIPTKGVYKKLRFPLTKKQKINRILKLLSVSAPPKELGKGLFNRLEEVVLPANPEIARIKRVFEVHGCPSLMSGSGSTVFGIVPDKITERKIKSVIDKFGWKSWAARTIA